MISSPLDTLIAFSQLLYYARCNEIINIVIPFIYTLRLLTFSLLTIFVKLQLYNGYKTVYISIKLFKSK